MSMNLFAYLNAAPSLEDISATFRTLGLAYRHTLQADERWSYPMHVFGGADLRVVYHAGDPARGDAMVDGRVSQDDAEAQIAVRMVLAAVVRHYGGVICDPREVGRGAVL